MTPRAKRTCRKWTPEEDRLLIELRLLHYGRDRGRPKKNETQGGLATIAEKLGRQKSSVYKRLNYLAKRDDLDS